MLKLTESVNRISANCFAAAFMLAAALMAGCSSNNAKTENADEVQAVEETAAVDETSAATEADAKVIELTDAAVLAPGVKVDRLTVVDFNAVWCGPCRQLAPVLDEMAAKFAGKADFYSVDVDNFGNLFEAWNMGNSIPAILILKPDGSIERYIGTGELLPAEKFEAVINKNL